MAMNRMFGLGSVAGRAEGACEEQAGEESELKGGGAHGRKANSLELMRLRQTSGSATSLQAASSSASGRPPEQ